MNAILTWVVTLTFYQQLIAVAFITGLCLVIIAVLVWVVIRLLKAISAFLRESDIKTVGVGGVEFYNDTPVTKPKSKPAKRTPRV